MLPRTRFIKACRNETPDRPPVWMMRQAGRTLQEYRAIREKYSFREVMENPELAAEVTLQPLKRFPVDAAIIFCDILVIPEVFGMDVQYSPKLQISPPIRNIADATHLKAVPPGQKLRYVTDTIGLVKNEVGHEKAVLGFSGAPYTLACYMIEGESSKHFLKVREMMYHSPQHFENLMDKITGAVIEYMAMQIDAGIDAIQLFDTWAGELGHQDYNRFVLPYIQRIFAGLKEIFKGNCPPLIYYINGIGNLLHQAADSGADIIGVDWRLSLEEVRQKLGEDTVVQGNLDPALLFAPQQEIRQRVTQMLDSTGGRGHIANLGHGLIPTTPVSGIAAFMDAVVNWRK